MSQHGGRACSVRVVTGDAAYFCGSVRSGAEVRDILLLVALQTGIGHCFRVECLQVDDLRLVGRFSHMRSAWTVAGFAAGLFRLASLAQSPAVRSQKPLFVDFLVACSAGLGADISRL